MKILIPTVPHTGTHLLSSFFEKAGFESVPAHMNAKPEKSVTTTHIDTQVRFNHVLGLMNEFNTVIPIRHPYLVAESWIRREQPLNRMLAAYRRLPAMYEAGAMFVPVDVPERDTYIKKVNKALGINLKPDWGTVVNGYHNTHTMTYKDISPPDEVKQMADEMAQFLSNFYEVDMTEAPKKRGRPKKEDPKFIEVIALRKMMNDETGEMAEIGDKVKKTREDAIKLQDAGVIKVII
jgi:hypothetical protein